MEGENLTLRDYLVAVGAMTSEQAQESVQRESSNKDEAERILKGGYRYSGDAKHHSDAHDSTDGRRQSKRVRSVHREEDDDSNDHDDSEEDDEDDDDDDENDHDRENDNRRRRSSESSTASESELYATLPRLAPRTSTTSTTSTTQSSSSNFAAEVRAPPHPALVSKVPAVPYAAACLAPPPPPPRAYEYAAYPAYMTFGVARPYDRRIPAPAVAAGPIAYFPPPLVRVPV